MKQQTTNIKSEYTTPWVKVWDVKPNVAVMSGNADLEDGEDDRS